MARDVQQLFASPYMRVNTTTDVTGVEICGALKNVLAIAAGIVEGLDLGHNAMAALVAQVSASFLADSCNRKSLWAGKLPSCNPLQSRTPAHHSSTSPHHSSKPSACSCTLLNHIRKIALAHPGLLLCMPQKTPAYPPGQLGAPPRPV